MKKNRRGLGRGLGALIQDTAPENVDAADSAPESSGHSDSPVDSIQENVPSTQQSGGESDSAPPATVGDLETTDSLDAKWQSTSSVPADGDPPALLDRYVQNVTATPAEPGVSRETRRPVDVFFPNRLASAEAPDDAPTPEAAWGPTQGRRRRPVPPVEQVSGLRSPRRENHAEAPQRNVSQDSVISLTGSTGEESQADTRSEAHVDQRRGATTDTAELKSIRVEEIHPNPRQPREVFDEDEMEELVASISEVGVLQPIVVRPVPGPTPYELVMGERRWRASQRAGLAVIPAIVRHTADTDLLRDALLENLHRSQLNPLEEAAAYEQLLEDFDCTQDELSNRIGRSRPQISNTLRLLRLPPTVQRRVASGVLSGGHARALLGLSDPQHMEELAQKVVSEGLSVRSTEELVSLHDGGRQAKPRARARRSDRQERLDYLATSLTDQLDTTVTITLGARKGKIAIDFASVEDLNRIMGLIQPEDAQPIQS